MPVVPLPTRLPFIYRVEVVPLYMDTTCFQVSWKVGTVNCVQDVPGPTIDHLVSEFCSWHAHPRCELLTQVPFNNVESYFDDEAHFIHPSTVNLL